MTSDTNKLWRISGLLRITTLFGHRLHLPTSPDLLNFGMLSCLPLDFSLSTLSNNPVGPPNSALCLAVVLFSHIQPGLGDMHVNLLDPENLTWFFAEYLACQIWLKIHGDL